METKKYEAFVMSVELGSLSKAAEKLGYTQSGITHMIQSVENEFGFSLMTRNKAGIVLTENGRHILPYLRDIIKMEKGIEREVGAINGLKSGTIRIGTFTSIAVEILPPVIKEFHMKYPGIQVNLIDGDFNELEKALLESELDMALMAYDRKLQVPYTNLFKDEMLAVLPENHKKAMSDTYPVTDFAKEKFIYQHTGLDNIVRRIFEEEHINPASGYDVRGDDAIMALVKSGLGVALMPELYLKEHSHGVVTKSLSPRRRYRSVIIAHPRVETNPVVADIFIRMLRKSLKKAQYH